MIVNPNEIMIALGMDQAFTDSNALLLQTLQPYVERAIESYLGFEVETKVREELLPGNSQGDVDSQLTVWDVVGNRAVAFRTGDRVLAVTYTPLRTVNALYEDRMAFAGQAPDAFAPTTLLTQGVDYYLDVDETGICRSGELIRVGSWPGIPRTVKVNYVSGYTPDELNGAPTAAINKRHIKLAVIQQMVHEFNEYKRLQYHQYRQAELSRVSRLPIGASLMTTSRQGQWI